MIEKWPLLEKQPGETDTSFHECSSSDEIMEERKYFKSVAFFLWEVDEIAKDFRSDTTTYESESTKLGVMKDLVEFKIL